MAEVKQINSQAELQQVARQLGVRADWHEPDEQEVTVKIHGNNFDNAGFWGGNTEAEWVERYGDTGGVEMWVTLHQDGKPVAEVNLATLFAFACGTLKG